MYPTVILIFSFFWISSINNSTTVIEIPIDPKIKEYTACKIDNKVYLISLRKKKLDFLEVVDYKLVKENAFKNFHYHFSHLQSNFYQLKNAVLLKPSITNNKDVVVHFDGKLSKEIVAPKGWRFNLSTCTYHEDKIFFLMDSSNVNFELFEFSNNTLTKLNRYPKAIYDSGGIGVYNVYDRILIAIPSKIGEYFYAVEYPIDTTRVYEFTSKVGKINKKCGTVISSPSIVYFTSFDSTSQSLYIESFYGSNKQVFLKENTGEFNLKLFTLNNKKYAVHKAQNTSSIYLIERTNSDNRFEDYFKLFNNKYEIEDVQSANVIDGKLYINLMNKKTNERVLGVIGF